MGRGGAVGIVIKAVLVLAVGLLVLWGLEALISHFVTSELGSTLVKVVFIGLGGLLIASVIAAYMTAAKQDVNRTPYYPRRCVT
jgi:hypothetical protein